MGRPVGCCCTVDGSIKRLCGADCHGEPPGHDRSIPPRFAGPARFLEAVFGCAGSGLRATGCRPLSRSLLTTYRARVGGVPVAARSSSQASSDVRGGPLDRCRRGETVRGRDTLAFAPLRGSPLNSRFATCRRFRSTSPWRPRRLGCTTVVSLSRPLPSTSASIVSRPRRRSAGSGNGHAALGASLGVVDQESAHADVDAAVLGHAL